MGNVFQTRMEEDIDRNCLAGSKVSRGTLCRLALPRGRRSGTRDCLTALMIENRNCHLMSPRGKHTRARWMDSYAPPSRVEHPYPMWSVEGPQKTGYHGSWEKQLGRVHGSLMGTFVGYICYVRLEKIHCTLSPHIFLYICYTSLLKTQLKQNRTKHLAGKQNPNQGQLTRNSTPGCFPDTAARRGDRASGAGDIHRSAVLLARVWLLGIISSDSLAPPLAS